MNAKPVTAPPEGRGDPFGLVGRRLDSRYDVVELVAHGGFGVVYRAQHLELRKPVAIKVLKIPADLTQRQQQEFLDRFTEEARTVAQLDHPNIVRVLDSGTSVMPSGARGPWMALEWLEGVTLEADFNERIVTGSGGRSPLECMNLMYPVIEAVGIAHEEGIVHRDIKPANLMIVIGRRGDARLKLLDFGIVKVMAPEERRAADRAQTLTQVQAFSPDYAAPEQVTGMRTGPWTDVHSLALLLSEMLTARIPFEGNDPMEMCASVLSPKRPTPGRLGVDVGPWEAVFARALSLKPSDRYENAGEFLTALMSSLPPGIDDADALIWTSQSGTQRLTPTASLAPRPSSGSALVAPTARPLASSLRPPSLDDMGRAPTLLAPEPAPRVATPPPPPPPVAREVVPELVILASEPDAIAAFSAPTDPPPSRSPSFQPPRASPGVPTEPLARPRSFVAPLLVVIGLCFGALVAGAVLLLIRPPPQVARRADRSLTAQAPPPASAAPALPAAIVADVPVAGADAPVAASSDASVVPSTVVDASADAAGPLEPSDDDPPRHRSRRHHARPHRSHRSHHGDPVPTE